MGSVVVGVGLRRVVTICWRQWLHCPQGTAEVVWVRTGCYRRWPCQRWEPVTGVMPGGGEKLLVGGENEGAGRTLGWGTWIGWVTGRMPEAGGTSGWGTRMGWVIGRAPGAGRTSGWGTWMGWVTGRVPVAGMT